jgi:predicted ArsR family transcriptional regulator
MTDTPLLDWVPYVRGSDTSRDAAESMRPHVSEIEQDILHFLKIHQDATCDQIEDYMGIKHQTASARLKGLADKGLIRDSGARRPTRSGRAARVYVAT